MRIFLICQQSQRRHDVPAYAFWEKYLKEGIAEASHTFTEAEDVDWAEGLLPFVGDERARWLGRTWSRAVASLKTQHAHDPIDLVLCYLFPSQVEPSALAEIRALGIPCVNFFCDNVREFTRVPEVFRGFDLHWAPEFEACELYRNAGLPFIHAPMPVWVPPAFRTIPDRETDDAVFIGSHDVLREALLADVVARGLPLRLYGAGWKPASRSHEASPLPPSVGARVKPSFLSNQREFLRTEGLRGFAMKLSYKLHRPPAPEALRSSVQAPIYGEDYFRATQESAVTLGINRYPSFRHSFRHPHAYSRLRDIEAPMLGACYLTEACPGLDRLYEVGREIETYRNGEELAAKAKELLASPARRRELRVNGRRRALSDHSITRSLEKIFSTLGL
jgi:hypothetical protein